MRFGEEAGVSPLSALACAALSCGLGNSSCLSRFFTFESLCFAQLELGRVRIHIYKGRLFATRVRERCRHGLLTGVSDSSFYSQNTPYLQLGSIRIITSMQRILGLQSRMSVPILSSTGCLTTPCRSDVHLCGNNGRSPRLECQTGDVIQERELGKPATTSACSPP